MTLIAFVKAKPYSILMADTSVIEGDTMIYTENKIEQIGDVIFSSSTSDLGKERQFIEEITPGLENASSIDELLGFLRTNRFKGYKNAVDMIFCHRKSKEGVRYSPNPKICDPIRIFGSCGDSSKVVDSHLQNLNRSMEWRKYTPSTDIARRALLEAAYKMSFFITSVSGPFDFVYLPHGEEKLKVDTIASTDREWIDTVKRLEQSDKERYRDLLEMARKDF